MSALIIALCHNYFEFAEKLISHNVDKNNIIHALHASFRFANQREIVSFLLSQGANVNSVDSNGMTVLMNAVKYATPDGITDLIQAGADVHAEGPDGTTAMSVALNMFEKFARRYRIETHYIEIMRCLVEAGADAKTTSENGSTTALGAAWRANREDLAQFFIDHGAY